MLTEILISLACLLAYAYWRFKQKWHFWSDLGIKTPPDNFPVGNSPMFDKRKNVVEVSREQYDLLKDEKYYGTYLFGRPVLIINDPEIMKQIMVKDFNHFIDRNRWPFSILLPYDTHIYVFAQWAKLGIVNAHH